MGNKLLGRESEEKEQEKKREGGKLRSSSYEPGPGDTRSMSAAE
jgi:hypothetical protein